MAAVLMTDEVNRAVYSSLERALVHTSTYSENGLAMRAGLATLDLLEGEQLGARATRLGQQLRQQLTETLAPHEMFKEIRGLGLLNGIEFTSPTTLSLRLPFAAFRAIHPGMFGQIVVMRLLKRERVLSQVSGNHFMVLKANPPLVASEEHIASFIASVDRQGYSFVHGILERCPGPGASPCQHFLRALNPPGMSYPTVIRNWCEATSATAGSGRRHGDPRFLKAWVNGVGVSG